jgi:hypothetical protein
MEEEEDFNSDTDSDTGSDSDLSICKELEDLEKQLLNTHLTLHTSIETLENIHALVVSGKNINILCGGDSSSAYKCDFDEVLEKLHTTAMAEIEASKGAECGEFSTKLLKVIEESEFCG